MTLRSISCISLIATPLCCFHDVFLSPCSNKPLSARGQLDRIKSQFFCRCDFLCANFALTEFFSDILAFVPHPLPRRSCTRHPLPNAIARSWSWIRIPMRQSRTRMPLRSPRLRAPRLPHLFPSPLSAPRTRQTQIVPGLQGIVRAPLLGLHGRPKARHPVGPVRGKQIRMKKIDLGSLIPNCMVFEDLLVILVPRYISNGL